MNTILEKAIKRQPITDSDIRMELAEICEQTACQCDSSCPVYELNGNKVVCRKGNPRCVCWHNGGAMLDFIREYYISNGLMRSEDQVLAAKLTEICERVHASCDSGCPVWMANGGKAPMRGTGRNRECMCFKGGSEMLKFLRKKEALEKARAEAYAGEEVWNGDPKANEHDVDHVFRGSLVDRREEENVAKAKEIVKQCHKCPGGFRAALDKHGKVTIKADKQTEGWIKVIRGKKGK